MNGRGLLATPPLPVSGGLTARAVLTRPFLLLTPTARSCNPFCWHVHPHPLYLHSYLHSSILTSTPPFSPPLPFRTARACLTWTRRVICLRWLLPQSAGEKSQRWADILRAPDLLSLRWPAPRRSGMFPASSPQLSPFFVTLVRFNPWSERRQKIPLSHLVLSVTISLPFHSAFPHFSGQFWDLWATCL